MTVFFILPYLSYRSDKQTDKGSFTATLLKQTDRMGDNTVPLDSFSSSFISSKPKCVFFVDACEQGLTNMKMGLFIVHNRPVVQTSTTFSNLQLLQAIL